MVSTCDDCGLVETIKHGQDVSCFLSSDELVALDLTTAKRTHALLHATSNRNSTHNRDSVGSQFSSEDSTSTVVRFVQFY